MDKAILNKVTTKPLDGSKKEATTFVTTVLTLTT